MIFFHVEINITLMHSKTLNNILRARKQISRRWCSEGQNTGNGVRKLQSTDSFVDLYFAREIQL